MGKSLVSCFFETQYITVTRDGDVQGRANVRTSAILLFTQARRGRPRTAWMDNIKTWTGLSVEESIRMTEDRDKWRKCVHGVANPRIEVG